MPEGDTAYRAAYHLAQALTDRILTRTELRVPRYATLNFVGERVRGAQSRGKHILIRVSEWTIHSHLGMDGIWLLMPPPRARTGASSGGTTARGRGSSRGGRPSGQRRWPAAHRIRARLDTDAVVALGVDLARLRAWPTDREEQELGWLGPDLLDPNVDLDEAARRILAEPDRPITAALLDQSNVAGIGNEYVTEMCFLRGVLPTRTVAEVGDIHEWLDLGRRLMVTNRDRVDRTFTGRLGTGETNYVFSRGGRPCRRCGTPILKGTHASGVRRDGFCADRMRDGELDGIGPGGLRVSSWCPHCQR